MDLDLKKTWSENYMLNIPILDAQHIHFFDLYSRLFETLNDVESVHEQEITALLLDLKQYALVSFKIEEDYLKSHNVSDLEMHIKHHENFFKKIEEFEICHQFKKKQLETDIMMFLKKWVMNHIFQYDMQIKSYL